jgi:hypothetical protein
VFPAASGGKTSLGGMGKDGPLFRTKATFERTACPLVTAHEKEKGQRLNGKGCEGERKSIEPKSESKSPRSILFCLLSFPKAFGLFLFCLTTTIID